MTGLPIDPAAAQDPIPEGSEESVESLDDVVALLVQKAEMDAGVAEAEATPGSAGGSTQPAAATPPTAPTPPGAPAAAGAPPIPKKIKKKTPGEKAQQFGLTGVTDDMIEWADGMIKLTGKDYRDG